MRIDKYLANMNVGSRKEVHLLIKKGIVAVNGVTVKTPKQQVKESDQVTVNGDAVAYQKYHYFLLNKPKGVLSATEDRSQPTVISLLAPQDLYQGIVPVGRLNKDTTGLLLLTNDGQLNHELLAPNKHVDKIYRAKIAGVADDETVKTFAVGMKVVELERISMCKLTLPANLKRGEYLKLKLEDIVK